MSEFSIRSPNIHKKRLDFGVGAHAEYVWTWDSQAQSEEGCLLNYEAQFQKKDVKAEKIISKWQRAIVLDSKNFLKKSLTKIYIVGCKLINLQREERFLSGI